MWSRNVPLIERVIRIGGKGAVVTLDVLGVTAAKILENRKIKINKKIQINLVNVCLQHS